MIRILLKISPESRPYVERQLAIYRYAAKVKGAKGG